MLKQYVAKVHNINQLTGWLLIKIMVTGITLFFTEQLKKSNNSTNLSVPIYAAQIFQTLQCFDIILILLKVNHGSLIGTLAQQLGRLVVVYYFMETSSSPWRVIGVLIPWSLAEVNRYSYYLLKNPLTTWLRYNAFIILYPLGVFGEMNLINDYVNRHASELSEKDVMYIRAIQGLIIVGFLFLYLYLFRSRSAKNRQQQNAGGEGKKKNLRSASPPKRD